mmetsp:Transcript_33378/g.37310  ORF Transcript_33378/g.37310 Transcript_33378/m.37310 type:complete len:466 (-) Transcript_33378:71-1468(-)
MGNINGSLHRIFSGGLNGVLFIDHGHDDDNNNRSWRCATTIISITSSATTTCLSRRCRSSSSLSSSSSSSSASTSFLMALPITIRVDIINFLGETQEELVTLTLISKEFNATCQQPGVVWRIINWIEICPSQGGNSYRLLNNLRSHLQEQQHSYNNKTKTTTTERISRRRKFGPIEISPAQEGSFHRLLNNSRIYLRWQQQQRNDNNKKKTIMKRRRYNKIQNYTHIIIKEINKFAYIRIDEEEFERITTSDAQMKNIISLNISSYLDPGHTIFEYKSLPHGLSRIMPNLRELNISNTGMSNGLLKSFLTNCPHLQKIIWHQRNNYVLMYLNGDALGQCSHTKLTEIWMDDSDFLYNCTIVDEERNMSDLSTNNDTNDNDISSNPAGMNPIFIFHRCNTTCLERVSIRNATHYQTTQVGIHVPIRQNALIKFVRCVPSLQWFRSDLTKENIEMLQLERPGIELVN